MSKLRPVSFSELVRKLKALDFEGPFSGGKDLFMIKGDLRLTISNPHRQDIGVDLLKRILKLTFQFSRDKMQGLHKVYTPPKDCSQ